MASKTMMIIAGVVAIAVAVAALAYVVLSDNEDGDADVSATINGTEISYEEMKDKLGTKTVDGKEGIPISALVNDTGLASPETFAYVLEATDGYAMAVNWTVMQKGIVTLVTETDEDTGNEAIYLMTVFPDLPSAYKVKNLASIDNLELTPIACNGLEYYLDYMPKKVGEKTVVYNETYSVTGWSLSDMVNYTGLANPESHEYTIFASDGYNKTVDWSGMMGGVILDENMKTVFGSDTGYAKKGYMVKNVVEIVVV
ncbi:MAG: hypothetical protein V1934_04685 [Methanobacteriota archaeon]